MTNKTNLPFGLWPSPVTPGSLAQSLSLSDVAWDNDGKTLVWLEGRSGQGVLVCATAGQSFRDIALRLRGDEVPFPNLDDEGGFIGRLARLIRPGGD